MAANGYSACRALIKKPIEAKKALAAFLLVLMLFCIAKALAGQVLPTDVNRAEAPISAERALKTAAVPALAFAQAPASALVPVPEAEQTLEPKAVSAAAPIATAMNAAAAPTAAAASAATTTRAAAAAASAAPTAAATSTAAAVKTPGKGLPPLPPGEEIYDITNPQKLAWPLKSIFLNILSAAAAVWLITRFYAWFTSPVIKKAKKIKQSPQRLALRAIERLKISPVWQRAQMKEICETIAAILKTYAHDAFNLGIGSASTTDEFLLALQRGSVSNRLFAQSRDLLEYCDKIKFTGVNTSLKEPQEILNELLPLVNTARWVL